MTTSIKAKHWNYICVVRTDGPTQIIEKPRFKKINLIADKIIVEKCLDIASINQLIKIQ